MTHPSDIITITITIRVRERQRKRAYAPLALIGWLMVRRLDGGQQMRNRLLITMNRTDGRLGARPPLRIGGLALEIVREGIKPQPRKGISQ
jgi:hypothetical protein